MNTNKLQWNNFNLSCSMFWFCLHSIYFIHSLNGITHTHWGSQKQLTHAHHYKCTNRQCRPHHIYTITTTISLAEKKVYSRIHLANTVAPPFTRTVCAFQSHRTFAIHTHTFCISIQLLINSNKSSQEITYRPRCIYSWGAQHMWSRGEAIAFEHIFIALKICKFHPNGGQYLLWIERVV